MIEFQWVTRKLFLGFVEITLQECSASELSRFGTLQVCLFRTKQYYLLYFKLTSMGCVNGTVKTVVGQWRGFTSWILKFISYGILGKLPLSLRFLIYLWGCCETAGKREKSSTQWITAGKCLILTAVIKNLLASPSSPLLFMLFSLPSCFHLASSSWMLGFYRNAHNEIKHL